jgi:hypothetical protein
LRRWPILIRSIMDSRANAPIWPGTGRDWRLCACVAVLVRRIWPLRGTDQVIALACISVGAFAWALSSVGGRALWRSVSRSNVIA